MTKVVMIADDLTGANANCSLMKKIGLQAASILSLDQELPREMGVLAYTTDSRAMLEKDAYDAVSNAIERVRVEDPLIQQIECEAAENCARNSNQWNASHFYLGNG